MNNPRAAFTAGKLSSIRLEQAKKETPHELP